MTKIQLINLIIFFIDSIENIVENDDINIDRSNLFNLFNFDCPNHFYNFKLLTLDDLYKIINNSDANKRSLDNSNNTSDFRPINQLPMYKKILEIIIKQQLEAFSEKNNILIKKKSGFRAKYSCETALQLV